MITVQQLSELFEKALEQPQYKEGLTDADFWFIGAFDNPLENEVIRGIADILNRVLDGNDLNKYKIPSLVKLIFILCKNYHKRNRYVFEKDVNLANVVRFVLVVILDANILNIDELEKLILIEIIDSSIFLLKTQLPVIKRQKWFSCFS